MTVVGVVGLGQVGLPPAIEFGKQYWTSGFDLSAEGFAASTELEPTSDPAALREADFAVVGVPTPVDDAHISGFSPPIGASTFVGRNLKRGATVVYESTVDPL